jgi:signal transduction histidine kinase/ActR/RegA family two-component response regulator
MPLINVVQELSFARDLSAIQTIVRRAARALTGADGATFVLRDGDECHYADEDAIAPLWKGSRFPLQACISGWTMLNRQAAVIADIYADGRIPIEAYRPTFVRSLVMVPIRSTDPVGAIGNYWATPHEATPEEVRTLQALADAAALAMENVRIFEQLEQRVHERTRELEAARQAAQHARESAERAHRAKSRFLAAASHDLRQPLQSLALLTGTLRRMVTDPDAREVLEQQELAIRSASQLVSATLDLTKLDSGAVRPEIADCEIGALFDELRREFTAVAADKGLDLRVDGDGGTVRSDPALLAQILRNLVSNAIKYTRAGTVSLHCLQEIAGTRIEVRDTGVGIPREHLPHIFDEFYQVAAGADARRGGYGLGLSIVTRLVELLQLRLGVSSEPGRGSVFSLDFPAPQAILPRPRSDTAPARPAEERPLQRRRVLLVEDDRSVREATRLLLIAEGHEVLPAASPAEALQRAEALGPPDLIITDYHLGTAETGLDVIAHLRRKLGRELKVILLSGDTSPSITGLVLDEHMRLARKPVNADHLLQLMSELTPAVPGRLERRA